MRTGTWPNTTFADGVEGLLSGHRSRTSGVSQGPWWHDSSPSIGHTRFPSGPHDLPSMDRSERVFKTKTPRYDINFFGGLINFWVKCIIVCHILGGVLWYTLVTWFLVTWFRRLKGIGLFNFYIKLTIRCNQSLIEFFVYKCFILWKRTEVFCHSTFTNVRLLSPYKC